MKSILLSALALTLAMPVFADSLRNPYDMSLDSLNHALPVANEKLYKQFEVLKSIEAIQGGWQFKTDHCTLDVFVTFSAKIYPLPSAQTHWHVSASECR